ncbi:hypothetical protein [Haloarcula montana]|uniref:hypothetical protein n=1 Tax=Haloarcula montana TaxID=3111776 RepID=UPI002D79EFE7|nr:hypothetical protein [Haloarcula sp. GH36]
MATELFKQVREGHVRERLQYLEYAGLVARLYADTWMITSEGSRYVDGDLDVAHQPRPNRGNVFEKWVLV